MACDPGEGLAARTGVACSVVLGAGPPLQLFQASGGQWAAFISHVVFVCFTPNVESRKEVGGRVVEAAGVDRSLAARGDGGRGEHCLGALSGQGSRRLMWMLGKSSGRRGGRAGRAGSLDTHGPGHLSVGPHAALQGLGFLCGNREQGQREWGSQRLLRVDREFPQPENKRAQVTFSWGGFL